jgi:hypothetical protein
MPQGPVQGPGTTPGGGQSGRPGVAGGTTGKKSFEQVTPRRDEGDQSGRPKDCPPSEGGDGRSS